MRTNGRGLAPTPCGLLVLAGLCLLPSTARASGTPDVVREYEAAHTTAIPSYARQTGLACSVCHYQFPALTPFGRRFKLEGYTLSTKAAIAEPDSAGGGKLGLSPFSLLSAMATASLTHTRGAAPDTQNGAVAMPQELGVFLAGPITPKIGLFSQLTYGGADGSLGIDNIDIRFADRASIGRADLVYGVTLHNNPTIQDPWNTTPGWGFPFIGSDGAPAGAAGTMIDGGLAQSVLGLGGYGLIDDLLYGELTVYRSAFQGSAAPSSATGAIQGVAPYWRIALQKSLGAQYLMIGTFGLRTRLYPGALTGPRNELTDVGLDAQFESKVGSGHLVARGSWVHESQTLAAAVADGQAANLDNTLKSLRVNTSYYPKQWLGVSAGYFQTTGSADSVLYAPAPVEGSASGNPQTNGFLGEVDVNPWENARIGAQYVAYRRFNGLGTDYDGSGRNASDNDTLFLFLWLAF